MESFSELIKKRRLEMNLTMRGLEAALKEIGVGNVSRSYINLLEKDRKSPTYDVAKSLAEALDIDMPTAIKAAYRSRIERDKQREREYLLEFIKNNDLHSLDIEKLMKQGYR